MAYIFGMTTSTANGASVSPTEGTHAIGDLLLVFASNDGGGTSLATASTGWSKLGTDAASAGSRSVWFWKIATGTTGETPTITGAADDWTFTFYVIRDVAASPFGASPASGTDYLRTDYTVPTGGIAIAAGALTTAVDNCLLLIGICVDSAAAGTGIKPNPDDYVLDTPSVVITNNLAHSTGHLQFGAAGATPLLTSYSNHGDGGNAWIIAVRPASADYLQKDVRIGADVIKWHGDFGNLFETLTYSSPKTNFDTTTTKIGTLDCSTTAPTVSTQADASAAPGSLSTFSDATNGGADVWAGMSHTISSTDMAGKVVALRWGLSSTSAPVGTKGAIVVFGSGATMTTDWAAYQLVDNPATTVGFAAGTYDSQIAVGVASAYDSAGTIDWSTVTRIGVFYHRSSGSATSRYVSLRNMVLLDSAKIIGGSASVPVQISYLPDRASVSGIPFVHFLQGSGQTLAKGKIQIGDGSTKTYFKHEAQSLEYPKPWVISDVSRLGWNSADSAVGVTVYASASDTVDFSAGVLATSTPQPFDIHASSSLSATYSFSGTSLVGWGVTDNAGLSWVNTTFKSGGTVTIAGGGDLTNCSISKTTSANAALAITANGSTLDGTTIDVTGTSAAYHLELGTAVTAITLTDVTFTGTPGTDKVHVLKTSGTVTITISGTTSLVAGDVTSAGSTVVIAAPSPTLDATVLANTRAVLYNRTADAEISNTLVAGTSWTHTVTSGASSGDVLDLYTFKEGYQESVATIIYSGADATFAVQQAVDDAVDYYRTAESITDYTTLTEFNFYAPDIYIQSDDADGATSLKRMFIFYNGALTTEDGARYMRGGVTFRSAFDVVINRSAVALAVDNVSATQGLYFTDESVIRVTTDDGTSWIAPPSAPGSIRYAFGVSPGQIETGVSGLTGPESAQLMALPSTTSIAAAVAAYAIEAGWTTEMLLRVFAAVLAGKVSGAGTGTETFRGINDDKDRVTATTDSSGNRTAITLDGS